MYSAKTSFLAVVNSLLNFSSSSKYGFNKDACRIAHKYVNIVENNFTYPVSINGKKRFDLELPIALSPAEIEKIVVATPEAAKWTEGKSIKKVIVVPKKIINIVIG